MKKMVFFAQNVRYERKKRNLTQEELAIKLQLKSPSSIATWEKNKGLPELRIFIEMCDYFGRTLDEMIYENLSGRPLPVPNASGPPSEAKVTESPPSVGVTEGGELEKNKDPVREALREIVREELSKMLK